MLEIKQIIVIHAQTFNNWHVVEVVAEGGTNCGATSKKRNLIARGRSTWTLLNSFSSSAIRAQFS